MQLSPTIRPYLEVQGDEASLRPDHDRTGAGSYRLHALAHRDAHLGDAPSEQPRLVPPRAVEVCGRVRLQAGGAVRPAVVEAPEEQAAEVRPARAAARAGPRGAALRAGGLGVEVKAIQTPLIVFRTEN